jgi:hypothetical protein
MISKRDFVYRVRRSGKVMDRGFALLLAFSDSEAQGLGYIIFGFIDKALILEFKAEPFPKGIADRDS